TVPVLEGDRGHRWKSVQGGEQSRQELHPSQNAASHTQIDASVERYLTAMDTADRAEPAVAQLKKGQQQDKIAVLKDQMQQLKEIETRMLAAPDQQISLTDPDARSMNARGSGIVGYNVQTAVEPKNHLIVSHEVTNVGNDRGHLATM